MKRARVEYAKATLTAACCVLLVVLTVRQDGQDGAGLIVVCAVVSAYFVVRARRVARADRDDGGAP